MTHYISSAGEHHIDLAPEEQGTVAMIVSNGLVSPVIHSVPNLWAKSPAFLLIPRAIAEADGLTIQK